MITGIQDITVTVKLSTRCGSKLTCDNLGGKTCEQCLEAEVERKLGDDGLVPHFKLQEITVESKPINTQIPIEPKKYAVALQPPPVKVEYGPPDKQGRPLVMDGAITVFIFHDGDKAWGPYFKLRSMRTPQGIVAGHTITRREAESILPAEVLEAKFQRAKASLLKKHPTIVLKLSNSLEG